jgi:PAS domain S-box-containing protein
MLTAILAGFWPGILATVLTALYVIVWVLPPYGVFAITNTVDAVGVALFFGMGVLMSGFAHLYHTTRERSAAEMAATNEMLRQSEERFRLMIESVKDYAIILLDPSGHVTSWNVGAERIKGYHADEILGKSFTVFYTPEDITAGKPQDELAQALAIGRFEEEGWRVRKDGARFWANVIMTPLYTADGVLFGFVKITRDISERRRTEEEQLRLNADLVQRTEELEVSLKEMETFSYSVAHDLRSPLRSLDGFSKYLLEHYTDRLDVLAQDYLRRMRTAAQRMARLIDDLLNLARIGRTEMRVEQVDLSSLASEIIDGLRRRDPDRRVEVEITPGLVAQGDRGLLRIALEHVLENAWKFTGTREVARITFEATTQAGKRVYGVQDNGVGFDMAYVDKLFQPFQRLHTEKEFPGTGIGLALIQRIMQRHGGRIWAEGVEGHRATFYFTLGEVNV